MSLKSVIIAGGGLAGLTCAKSLVDAGMQVTVLEGMPFLGGRASTYRDADGEWIEQGLHLFLGVYTEFKRLLDEIDQPPREALFWMDQVHLQDPDGPQATYGVNPIFSPLKTLISLATQNDYLGILDKLSMLPLAAPALANLESVRKQYDGLSVTEWWRKINGREEVLERVLRPLCRAVQFTDAEDFSAYDFLGWAHHSIYHLPSLRLAGYEGARDESIFAPLGRYLTDRGATIRVNAKLQEIALTPDGSLVNEFIFESGEHVRGDAFVVGIPAWALVPLIPHSLRSDPFFAAIERLPIAPAISVQMWFDREVIGNPDFHLVARTQACVYQQQSQRTYTVERGSRISVIVSPADDLMSWSEEAIAEMVQRDLGKVNPEISAARITKVVVLKHKQHLVRPLPGAMSARPTQRTPVANLFLTGDWTQQEFFGSQEGAVRAGRACAEAILSAR